MLSEKIDHMEDNLTRQIADVKSDLGARICDLTGRVQTQNGRVGKLEGEHMTCRAEVQQLTRRRIAVIGGGGIVSGAALVEIAKWIGSVAR